MQTRQRLLILVIVAGLAISAVSAQQSGAPEGPFGHAEYSNKESAAQFVNSLREKNPEFAMLCDACLNHSKAIMASSKLLAPDLRANPIILESLTSGPQMGTPYSPAFLHPAITVPPTLSQTEKVYLKTIYRNIAESLLQAYREYTESLRSLRTDLDAVNRPQVVKEFASAKDSRTTLIELSGETAVSQLDAKLGAAKILKGCEAIALKLEAQEKSEKFRTAEPDLSELCDAYFERSSDLQLISKKMMTEKRFSEPNPLILAMSEVLAIKVSNSNYGYQLGLNNEQLEAVDAVQRDLNKKAWLSATEMIMLVTIARSDADKLKYAYSSYRTTRNQFGIDFLFQIKPNVLNPSAHKSAKEFLSRREALVELCGEKAVSNIDLRSCDTVLYEQALKLAQ